MTALEKAGRFALDTETTSLDVMEAELVGMSFCWGDEPAVYVPIAHLDGPNCDGVLSALKRLLEDPDVQKIGQNIKYDYKVLKRHGVHLKGIAGDTMLADYLVAVDQRHGLDHLARRYLSHDMIPYSEVTKDTGGAFALVPVEKAARYAAEDAHVTWLVDQAIDPSCSQKLYDEVEVPLIPLLAEMELRGIGVDISGLESMSIELEARIESLQADIYAGWTGVSAHPTKQLAQILFEERGLTPIKKTKTGFSTDAKTLEALARGGDALVG